MSIKTSYSFAPGRQIIIPRDALCRTYGTVITFDETQKVHYEMDVAQLGSLEEEGCLFFLNRKQVYVNNQAPYLLADRLADEIGSVLYPLLLMVDPEGAFKRVINRAEMLDRWEKKKEGIARYYKGAIVEQAITRMDVVLKHDYKLNEAIKSDWFFAVFFARILGKRAFSYKQELDLQFPLVAYGPMVNYRVLGHFDKKEVAEKTFAIQYKGNVCEERSVNDILQKRPVPLERAMGYPGTEAKGSAVLNYLIYKKDYSIRSVWGMVMLQGDPDQKVKFETYHQDTRDRLLKEAVRFDDAGKKSASVV
ncbi:hypothetical protein LL912_13695 [Niabella sp. CC-SYL272]|uniref:hypothetical protein n=1 Tax=Niabella agricola TaxID=2891571 RepID=UPI001F21CDC8|nr:hypothetical protein [Niabella agricola]MCF3109828.1 hypothetical protein [Niabella agricola]